MQELTRDIRYAIRTLLRAPGFTAVAVFTLALGIGANTAIFSVFNGVLLRPLDYPQADSLIAIFRDERSPNSPANFLDLAAQSKLIEDMTAAHPWSPVLRGEDRPEPVKGLKASPSLFRMLGAKAELGRTFIAAEDSDAGHVVVLGHDLWQRRFGEDLEIVGQSITLDGEGYTVIGVMPPGFAFPPFWATGAQLWVPLIWGPEDRDNRHSDSLRIFGRLGNGVDLDRARTEVDTLALRLADTYPEQNEGLVLTTEALREPVVSSVRGALAVLLGTVSFVLLIACANVANLFLVRGAGRRQEIAIRTALGAGRGNVIRQLLTESTLLALLAGGCGLLLGLWGVEALAAVGPDNVPRLDEVTFDGRVYGYTLLIALFTGSVFGLFPALSMLRTDLRAPLSEGNRQVGARGGGRARSLLVIAEIAMSLILLIGAGLTLKSLVHLWHMDPGFHTEGVLTVDLTLSGTQHETEERQNLFFDEILTHVRSVPGVVEAGLINHLPIGGDMWGGRFQVEGRPAMSLKESPRSTMRTLSPGLIEALGIPLLHGRTFDATDREDSSPTVIVSQDLAQRYWGATDVVGKRIREGGPDSEAEWATVVGVVGNVRQWDLTGDLVPGRYFPYRQNPFPWFLATSLVLHVEGDPEAMRSVITNRLIELEPTLPIAQIRTMDEILSGAVSRQRFNASLLTLFAALALILAAVGIYGVMSYTVHHRRSEIGVRMALGAGRRQILKLVVGQGLWLTAAGLAIGLLAAFALVRFLSGLLFGVGILDPTTFVVVSLLLTFVALAACYLPAHRASHFDPVTSLRSE